MENGSDKKDVRVLLISDGKDSANHMEQYLQATSEFSPLIFHCSGLSESIDTLRKTSPLIDVILVDLHLISSSRPREVFRRMGDAIDSVPIIVFNGTIEHDLALFLIEEGAADNITKDQADADHFRLSRAIEHSIARNHISQKHKQKTADEVLKIREQWQAKLKAANSNGAAALRKSEEQSAEIIAEIIGEKDRIISWMSGGYSM